MTVADIKQRFGIIGNSPLLERALVKAMQVSGTDISVLVTGESGVGKEAIPKIIHHLSHRKHNSYVAVNCGAIPEGTIDSELFGHEKGAFTGAVASRKGYFEEADGGTIFLDEVGELPLPTQVRLLRVLETGEFIRVGASRPQKTNVRVVAATNVQMFDAIKKGKFREDLYYRLNTVEIQLPPLRERREDIHLLFRKFARDFGDKYHQMPVKLLPEAAAILEQYHWPGNIRQLRNLAEQMSVMEMGKEIGLSTIQQYIADIGESRLPVRSNYSDDGHHDFSSEREILYKVLFDMRQDLTDLRSLVLELAKRPNMEDVREQHPALVRRILDASKKPDAHIKETSVPLVPIIDKPELYPAELYEEGETVEEENLSLLDKEVEMIRKSLEKHNGRRRDAAQELGISERTLYRKIKQFNL
jgi:transcriptional regulator with PAS, ATPase and Fis domain